MSSRDKVAEAITQIAESFVTVRLPVEEWQRLLEPVIAAVEERTRAEAACIHCGSNDPDTKHWEHCPEHPALQRIAELEAAIDRKDKLGKELTESVRL